VGGASGRAQLLVHVIGACCCAMADAGGARGGMGAAGPDIDPLDAHVAAVAARCSELEGAIEALTALPQEHEQHAMVRVNAIGVWASHGEGRH
jgi:hypothetical protein